jgi:colanic acid/amylovoran biosynthesis protein
MSKLVPQIGIVAATFTGNRGAEAMLLSVAQQSLTKNPSAEIHVLSYVPTEDRVWLEAQARLATSQIFIHSATPLRLVLDWFVWGCLLKLLPFLKRPLRPCHGQGFRALTSLDALVDLAGVSFMDSRLKFLPFNVLTVWLLAWHKVPVFKLAQAMGPFTHPINRILAKWVLGDMRLVVARGARTAEHLRAFGLKGWIQAPDTAFTLKFSPRHAAFQTRAPRVLIMPSSLMHKKHVGYLELLTRTVELLRAQGVGVDLMAHSWKEGTDKLRNNDWPLCERIRQTLASPADLQMWGPGHDAIALKEIVSDYQVVLTSRFHGMVAALDTGTPVWVLGWSHKYREILTEFGLDAHALPYEGLSADALAQTLAKGLAESGRVASQIVAALPRVRQSAQAQFDRMFEELS